MHAVKILNVLCEKKIVVKQEYAQKIECKENILILISTLLPYEHGSDHHNLQRLQVLHLH